MPCFGGIDAGGNLNQAGVGQEGRCAEVRGDAGFFDRADQRQQRPEVRAGRKADIVAFGVRGNRSCARRRDRSPQEVPMGGFN